MKETILELLTWGNIHIIFLGYLSILWHIVIKKRSFYSKRFLPFIQNRKNQVVSWEIQVFELSHNTQSLVKISVGTAEIAHLLIGQFLLSYVQPINRLKPISHPGCFSMNQSNEWVNCAFDVIFLIFIQTNNYSFDRFDDSPQNGMVWFQQLYFLIGLVFRPKNLMKDQNQPNKLIFFHSNKYFQVLCHNGWFWGYGAFEVKLWLL